MTITNDQQMIDIQGALSFLRKRSDIEDNP
jgi:hypothetical protein